MPERQTKRNKGLIVLGIIIGLAALGQVAEMATGGTSTPARPELPPPASTAPAKAPADNAKAAAKPDPPASTPTADQLAIDETYFKVHKKNPGGDAYKVTARRHKTSSEDVLEAVSMVAEYRAALLAEAKRSVTGIVGDLDIKTVSRTAIGVHTAMVSFTAVRCPEGDPRRDKKLELLATAALKTLATKLPAVIDSYRAALWYRGISCDRGSMGYGATWTRSGGITLE
ncbi:MAG: hypothetical protein OEZ06_00755 [Myxococcales bacterium]|nr:hypothetical protein [Myxococcales bacterium]